MATIIAAVIVALPLAGAVIAHKFIPASQPAQFKHYDFR